jgi:hypothetical protein
MRREPPECAPARGLATPAFAPMIEVIARANREAERKKEPAAAFWGNELIREFAMKPMSQSRRTGPCRQTDDAWRNKANAIPGQQLASGATAGESGAEFDPKLTPRYREAATHGILTKRTNFGNFNEINDLMAARWPCRRSDVAWRNQANKGAAMPGQSPATIRREAIRWTRRRVGKAKRAHAAYSLGVGTAQGASLPTLVLARIARMGSFREEWPGPGGHPDQAADRSDQCPPKPQGLFFVARSRSALHRDPDG